MQQASAQKDLAPHDHQASSTPVDWSKIVQFPAGRIAQDMLARATDEVINFVKNNSPLNSVARHKPHLLLPAVYDLGQSPEIFEAVRKFLGTDDFFQMYSVLFVKEKNTEGYVPWHYDDYFWGLDSTYGCTAWVALGDVTKTNGAMEFVPGDTNAAVHYVHFERNNMLIRGNNSTFEPKPNDEHRFVELKAGEFSIHSHKAWHRSGPNLSPNDRVAVAFRFITNDARPKKFKFLGRGGVPRAGRPLPRYFYTEQRPTKPLAVGANWQHRRSIVIASILTSFGDSTRSFASQMRDFVAMASSARFFKLFGQILSAITGKKAGPSGAKPQARSINDG